jgi:glycerol-3-phosphate acyltransferase PlsY
MNALTVVAAYLIGSIPFAFLLARRRGVDLRLEGSGNVGASNVLRTSGMTLAVLAMALDGLKGILAVLLAQGVAPGSIAPVAAGLASVIVATAAGAFSLLAPVAFAVACAVFVLTVLVTRIISVGSLSAAVALAMVTAVTDSSRLVIAGACIAAGLIVFRHRGNLSRLMAGTERRVGGA